jgi:Flp pilus assembly protein CpaB
MTVTHPAPSAPDRRALGVGRSRRRPGTALLLSGVALVGLGGFIAGQSDGGGSKDTVASLADPVAGTSAAESATTMLPEVVASRTAPALAVPEGHDGVAITLAFAAAGGGYVGPGDRLNLHVASGNEPGAGDTQLLGNVLVLDVSTEVAPRVVSGTAERPSSGQITYLLAVPSDRVGALVETVSSSSLYVSLVAGSGLASDEETAR